MHVCVDDSGHYVCSAAVVYLVGGHAFGQVSVAYAGYLVAIGEEPSACHGAFVDEHCIVKQYGAHCFVL